MPIIEYPNREERSGTFKDLKLGQFGRVLESYNSLNHIVYRAREDLVVNLCDPSGGMEKY